MYCIIAAPTAKKRLKTIAKIYRKGITETIDSSSEDPYQGKPLIRELTDRYTYRVGVYNIIYIISERDKTIHIIHAGHRATIYQ